ncbi:MAG: hypothetical protein RIQ28_403 [Pseudomonadota bacterium]|jgi:hypothetical protein
MNLSLYVNARDVREAQALITRFGDAAGLEAAERAEASRNLGNHIHFCRWRQIERLVTILNLEMTAGTLH